MKILVSSEVTIYDPTDAVIFYCMDNFTVKNPEFERRLRRGRWLGDTPEYLDLYNEIQNSKDTYASDKAYMEDLNNAIQNYYNTLGESAALENSII